MFHNNAAIRQVLRIAAGEAVCILLMLGVYAVIGRLTAAVVIGAVFGGIVSVGNFLALSITVSRAADRAESGEPEKGKLSVQASSVLRLLVLGALYVIVLRAGVCDPVAAILPLLFIQISINIIEYFRKDGEKQK